MYISSGMWQRSYQGALMWSFWWSHWAFKEEDFIFWAPLVFWNWISFSFSFPILDWSLVHMALLRALVRIMAVWLRTSCGKGGSPYMMAEFLRLFMTALVTLKAHSKWALRRCFHGTWVALHMLLGSVHQCTRYQICAGCHWNQRGHYVLGHKYDMSPPVGIFHKAVDRTRTS